MFRPWLLCRARVVYGAAFPAASAVRLTLIVTLPVTTAVWASGVVLPAAIVVAIAAAAPFTARAATTVDAAVG